MPKSTDLLVLLLCAEVALDNVEGLLVDLDILVRLQELYLVQSEHLDNILLSSLLAIKTDEEKCNFIVYTPYMYLPCIVHHIS